MHLTQSIYAVGTTGLFPSRAFMPAFGIALFLRFGSRIPLISHTDLVRIVEGAPSWFTHDVTLVVLGVLSVVEFLATKNSDIREVLDEWMGKVNTVVALLVDYSLLSMDDADVVRQSIGMDVASGTMAVGFAGAVYYLSERRRGLYGLLSEMDPDDSFGLQRLASWFEDWWVLCGVLLLIVLPWLLILLTAVVFFFLWIVRKELERREDATKVPCGKCGTRILPSAVSCFQCSGEVKRPCAVGLFGQAKPAVPAHPREHRLRLLETGRCPACASRLTSGQECGACRRRVFDDGAFIDSYVQFIDQRYRIVIPACFVLSLVPVIGVVPAIVYYRLSLVAPYRRHISRGSRLATRWTVRLINFGLLSVQWVPILGGFTLPLMATVSHRVHRSAFRSTIESMRRSGPTKRAISADVVTG